jgi:hypothetical protein
MPGTLVFAGQTNNRQDTIMISSRRHVQRDNGEFYAMIQRMIRAYGRRAGAGDADDLTALASTAELVESTLREAITAQRAGGASWAYVGDALGMSKQAAAKRFGGVE